MRVRRLQQRARPFRYAGFWIVAGLCPLLSDGRTAWQPIVGAIFCGGWPWLADRIQQWPAEPAGMGFQRLAYVAECALAGAVLAWVSLPPLPAMAVAMCLLAGATALAGWQLLAPAAAAAVVGAGLGAWWSPGLTAASSPWADGVGLALMLAFALVLAHQSFRQAQRLDAQRLTLAHRSADLERLNRRMQRYLPPSLRSRLEAAPEAPCRWERRWLCVAFIDLVGFTALAERMDAEPLAGILDDYLAVLVRAADQRGGEVSKLLGDGVMVVFAHRDGDGRREQVAGALDFCREVPELLGALAARWRARGDVVALETRAGVASGYCTLGDRGGADRLDFTLIGGPVNLASRLQSRAPVNGVLMDAATAALAEQAYDLGPARMLDIKGLGSKPAYVLP